MPEHRGLRIAAQAQDHPLHRSGGLPPDVCDKIVEAHQALMAASGASKLT